MSWTWACIIVKFSLAGPDGLSAAHCSVMLSVSGRQKFHSHIKNQTWCSQSQTTALFASPLSSLPRETKCWLFFMTYLPSFSSICQEKTHKQHTEAFSSFEPLLALNLHFLDMVSSTIERFEDLVKNWISRRNDNVGQQHCWSQIKAAVQLIPHLQ